MSSAKSQGMPVGSKDLVVIGEVTKPHGLRGEVCIRSYADSPSLFDQLSAVYLRPGPQAEEAEEPTPPPRKGRGRRPMRPRKPRLRRYSVVSWRSHKGAVLVTFEGVADRTAAEALRGYEMLVREADLPELTDEELYLYQIEGLSVVLEGGEALGTVREVQMPAGQELWAIDTPDGREVLFPVAEEFVRDVDLDARVVVIAPPPGLLDLYLGDD
ncbi:ribosome maturation factor RimM [Desulfobaculum sp.]|jgi:16S rRNA processing protein RimM